MVPDDGPTTDGTPESTYRISPSERPSEAVLKAVSDATGICMIGSTDDDGSAMNVLDPLYEAIDPEALDSIFEPTIQGTQQRSGRLTFDYANCEVTLLSSGLVRVQRNQNADESPSVDD
jgi:hypothetical protein